MSCKSVLAVQPGVYVSRHLFRLPRLQPASAQLTLIKLEHINTLLMAMAWRKISRPSDSYSLIHLSGSTVLKWVPNVPNLAHTMHLKYATFHNWIYIKFTANSQVYKIFWLTSWSIQKYLGQAHYLAFARAGLSLKLQQKVKYTPAIQHMRTVRYEHDDLPPSIPSVSPSNHGV